MCKEDAVRLGTGRDHHAGHLYNLVEMHQCTPEIMLQTV